MIRLKTIIRSTCFFNHIVDDYLIVASLKELDQNTKYNFNKSNQQFLKKKNQ